MGKQAQQRKTVLSETTVPSNTFRNSLTSSFSEETVPTEGVFTQVVSEIKNYMKTTCVYLIWSSTLSDNEPAYKQSLVQDQSLFSEKLIATSLLDVDTLSPPFMNSVLCSGGRAMYVLNERNRNHTNHILQTV
ncbi:unnamed protein product, partial [Timema podura]|nr:unnamed protein product [Timema podura]